MDFTRRTAPKADLHEDEPGPSTRSAIQNQRLSLADIFIGSDGLRPLWGILLFVGFREIFNYLIYPLVLSAFAAPPLSSGLIVPASMFPYEGAGLLCLIFATLVMATIEQVRPARYGFDGRHGVRNFCAGAAWGFVLLSLLAGILYACGLLIFDSRLLSFNSAIRNGAIWLTGFLLVALVEEIYSRGYLQFTLTRGFANLYRGFGSARADALGFWSAALILSVAFGLGHRVNPGESPLGLVSASVAGLLFCFSLWRTGSLWWAIGFHALWDWAQSFLYGVADSGLIISGRLSATHAHGRRILSGGLTGPEGSVFMLMVMAIGAAILRFTVPKAPNWNPAEGAPERPVD